MSSRLRIKILLYYSLSFLNIYLCKNIINLYKIKKRLQKNNKQSYCLIIVIKQYYRKKNL